MFLSIMKVVSIIISPFFFLVIRGVSSYSSGAGTCRSGGLSGFGVSGHGSVGMGSLADGALVVKVGSNALSTSSTLDIFTGTDYTLTLEYTASSGAGFKGFLFRLNSKNDEVNVSNALTIRSSSDAQKLPSTGERNFRTAESTSACAVNVAGITHTNGSIKNFVSSITLNVEDPTDLVLEVTAVRARLTNNWHHSTFELKAVAPPTESPSSHPSNSPTLSYVPTMVPSGAPTPAPTPAVTGSTTSNGYLVNISFVTLFAGIVTIVTYSASFLFEC